MQAGQRGPVANEYAAILREQSDTQNRIHDGISPTSETKITMGNRLKENTPKH